MVNRKAHNINNIMGAPLVALVEAECHAAATTAEFIKNIGFHNTDSESDSLGELKMITFYYEKCDSSGRKQKYKMEVPLLSLIQIPVLKIKDAKIDYGIKVIAVDKFEKNIKSDISNQLLSSISEKKLDIMGSISQNNSSNTNKLSAERQLKVSMNLEQGDLPLGVLNLLNTMKDTIKIIPVSQEKYV